MSAVVWQGPEKLTLSTVPAPEIRAPNDAILRVTYASTCGTDVHIYRGNVPGFEPGTVIGHEFVGEVVAVGQTVKRFQCGQRVRCSDFTACGSCEACLAGRHTQCGHRMLFGFSGLQPRLDGGMAEYVRVPWADVTLDSVRTETDSRALLLSSDVLPVALEAVNRASVYSRQSVAVVGAGPVGMLTAILARLRGATVLLLETSQDRVNHARQAGLVVRTVNGKLPISESIPDLVAKFDVTIDAVGGERGLTAALALVRAGGKVVGIGSQIAVFPVDWGRMFQREINLHFVIGNPIGVRAEIDNVMADCKPFLDLMFSDAIALSAVPKYFLDLYQKERFKALVDIGDLAANEANGVKVLHS